MNSLWCITTFFNPVGYKTRIANYHIFRENLEKQNVNLLTVELAFGNEPFHLSGNILQLRSRSVLWQKERMINYAISQLPTECKYVAWIDADIIFECPFWQEMLIKKFESGKDIIQLFEKVVFLPPGEKYYSGKEIGNMFSMVWQYKYFQNWLELCKLRLIPYAVPGFAWAAKREILQDGLYDKHILGTNDTLFVDSCMSTWSLHNYLTHCGEPLKQDMLQWANNFSKKSPEMDFLPIPIYHLYHGNRKNRGYNTREDILGRHLFDPNKDIKLENNVYEWSSSKRGLHSEVWRYFPSRKEDD